MKKVLSLVAACLLLVGMMSIGFTAAAATPKEEIVAAVKEAMPDKYEELYLPSIENVLSQIEVTAEQADAVVKNIAAAKAAVAADKGASLSEYPVLEQEAVLAEFDAACKTLGISYELVDAENPVHKGDIDCKIYVENKQVGAVDGDGVKKTGAVETNAAMTIALVSMLALAAGAAVCGKKIAAR